jgi:hypothetical protein
LSGAVPWDPLGLRPASSPAMFGFAKIPNKREH